MTTATAASGRHVVGASVVVRTYTEQRWDLFVRAVASLEAQTRPPDQVVLVVDNNPALLDRVRARFPAATVVPADTRGSAGAWNTGLRHARSDVVAFMDDDAAAEPDWLERLLAPYGDERVLGVGGRIVPEWQDSSPDWFPPEFHWVVGCTYVGLPEHPASVRNLIGCNMSFRRTALERAGGFHEIPGLGHMGAVPVGCDETEMCIRLRRRHPGGVLLYQPAAAVRHAVPPARASFRYFWSRCALEGRSKAIVSQLAGARDGLSTERRYVLATLPAGVVRGVGDAVRGDPAGMRRAAAIVAGVSTTAATYLAARVRIGARGRRDQAPAPLAPGGEG